MIDEKRKLIKINLIGPSYVTMKMIFDNVIMVDLSCLSRTGWCRLRTIHETELVSQIKLKV